MVQRATVGMKEVETSQLTVLNNLFTPMSKKRVKELGIGEEEESKYVARLSREVEGTGAVDKIALGEMIFLKTIVKLRIDISRLD
jgi:chromosome transmission fidelity protein 18